MDGAERVLVNRPAGTDHPVEVTPAELDFLRAVDRYRSTRRRFPTWREVLAIVRALGYRRVAAERPLPVPLREHGPGGVGRVEYRDDGVEYRDDGGG